MGDMGWELGLRVGRGGNGEARWDCWWWVFRWGTLVAVIAEGRTCFGR